MVKARGTPSWSMERAQHSLPVIHRRAHAHAVRDRRAGVAAPAAVVRIAVLVDASAVAQAQRQRAAGLAATGVANLIRTGDVSAADRELQKDLGARGLEFVQRNYRKERLVEDIKRLYRELMISEISVSMECQGTRINEQ